MKPTFEEKKALMQLSQNPFLTPAVLKSKRAMRMIETLREKGWIDEDNEVTETGLAHLSL